MIAIGNTPLPNLSDLRLVTMQASSRSGCTNIINQDGTVMSVQVNGSVESRPAGTDGDFEQGMINGSWIVYAPFGQAAYAFPLFLQVPA